MVAQLRRQPLQTRAYSAETGAGVKTISSWLTFLYRFVVPGFVLFVSGTFTFVFWLVYTPGLNGENLPAELRFSPVVGILISFALARAGRKWKRARLDGGTLYVSDYFREIAVPLREIAGVNENIFPKTYGITVHFRQPTLFGTSIDFLPVRRLYPGWENPIVTELKALAAKRAEETPKVVEHSITPV
jgi:hypothetical protein